MKLSQELVKPSQGNELGRPAGDEANQKGSDVDFRFPSISWVWDGIGNFTIFHIQYPLVIKHFNGKNNHVSVIFLLKPPFIGNCPASHVWLPEGRLHFSWGQVWCTSHHSPDLPSAARSACCEMGWKCTKRSQWGASRGRNGVTSSECLTDRLGTGEILGVIQHGWQWGNPIVLMCTYIIIYVALIIYITNNCAILLAS